MRYLIFLLLAGCVTNFKMVYEKNAQPDVYSRVTGKYCRKVYDGFSQEYFTSGYGDDCQVELRRPIK